MATHAGRAWPRQSPGCSATTSQPGLDLLGSATACTFPRATGADRGGRPECGARSRERTASTGRQVMSGRWHGSLSSRWCHWCLLTAERRAVGFTRRSPATAKPQWPHQPFSPRTSNAPRASRPPTTVRPTTPPKPAEFAHCRPQGHHFDFDDPTSGPRREDSGCECDLAQAHRARRCWPKGTRQRGTNGSALGGSPRQGDAELSDRSGHRPPFASATAERPLHGHEEGAGKTAGAFPVQTLGPTTGRSAHRDRLREGPRAMQLGPVRHCRRPPGMIGYRMSRRLL